MTSVYRDPLHFDAEPELEIGIFAVSRHLDVPLAVVVDPTVDPGHLTDGNGPFGHAQPCPSNAIFNYYMNQFDKDDVIITANNLPMALRNSS